MLNKPDIHFNFKLDFANYMKAYIDSLLCCPSSFDADDDKIILAALWEIRQKLAVKLATKFQQQYKVKLSACQAIALRLVYTTFDTSDSPWIRNELRLISDRVHRHYAL